MTRATTSFPDEEVKVRLKDSSYFLLMFLMLRGWLILQLFIMLPIIAYKGGLGQRRSQWFLGLRRMKVDGWCRQIMQMGWTMNYWSALVTKPVQIEYFSESDVFINR